LLYIFLLNFEEPKEEKKTEIFSAPLFMVICLKGSIVHFLDKLFTFQFSS